MGSSTGRQVADHLVEGIVLLACPEDHLQWVTVTADRQQKPQRNFDLTGFVASDLPLAISTKGLTESDLRQPQSLTELSQVGGEVFRPEHALPYQFLKSLALGNVLSCSIEAHHAALRLIPDRTSMVTQPACFTTFRENTELTGIRLTGGQPCPVLPHDRHIFGRSQTAPATTGLEFFRREPADRGKRRGDPFEHQPPIGLNTGGIGVVGSDV